MSTSATSEPDRPRLRVVRGDATAEDLAALTALLAARTGGTPRGATPPRRGRWNDPAARVRRPWQAGPGGWAAAARTG